MSSKEGEGDISAASDESNESKSADEFEKPNFLTEIDKPGHSKTPEPEDSNTLTEGNVPEQNPEIAEVVESGLTEQEEKAMVEMTEECSNDTLEDEIKLLWDDDDNSEDLEKSQEETKKSPEETKESPDDSQKSPEDTKSSDIHETDKDIQILEPSKILTNDIQIVEPNELLTRDCKSEAISNINDSMTSPNDTDMSININTEHAVTKPDVMLDIPTQELLDMEQDFNSDEPDEETHSSGNSIENKDHGLKKPDLMLEIPTQELLEEEQDLINLEMSSDKDSNPDETNDLTDILSKVNAEIAETISAIDDSDACKLEIPDEVDNTESGQKEVNISSDEESNEEQGQPENDVLVEPDTVNEPTDKSNLIEAIQNEVQALADTMSSIEEQELLDSPLPEPEKIGLTKASKMVTNAPKSDEKVVRIVPKTAEERKREINMKVSTLINNIEEEMQLIDAQNEAEAMDVDVQEIKKVTEDVISLDDVPEKVTSENLMEDETDDVEIVNVTQILQSEKDKGIKKDIERTKKRKVQNKDKITVSDSDNIDSLPDVEPESSETTEKEAKLKEEDEIALAVKTIEENTEIVEPTPVVSVLKADELSEISVIEDEDQSISLVLDDDSVEMEMQPQASVDESEISVIQDSDDEDPVILVADAENVSNLPTDKQGMEESSIEKNYKQLETEQVELEPDSTKNIQVLEVSKESTTVDVLDAEITLVENKTEIVQDLEKDDVIQSAEITSVQAEGLEIPSVVDKDAAIIPLEQKETDIPDSVQKDVECIEPQPSTSKELERRVSSDVPEHHDSMDLLAESTRLRADDDDQEDDDDDEDFYHDESSNLMTAEHSDESNAHTEADGTKHLHEDSNDNTQVTEDRDTQEINIEGSELNDETGEKEMEAAEMADKAFDDMMSSVKEVQTDEVVTDTEPKASDEGTETVPDLKDTTETAEEPKSHEVFNIDSDDDTTPTTSDAPSDTTATETAPQPVLRDIKCVNPLCEHPAGSYFLADAATLEFYDGGRRRALVCEECLQRVRDRQEDLMEGIRNLTPLLELNMNTYGHDLVEISDSESDGEEEEDVMVKEKLGEAGAKFVEEHLEDLFNETWRKYDMDSRLADTEMVLQMELRTLEKETKEMKSFLDECQASTDRVRNELYATFPQEAKEDPPLLIYDTPEQQYCYVQALPQSTTKLTNEAETPTAAQTRLSKRRLEASAASETPAKRPAIPLGYTPLDELNFKTETTDNKPTATPTVEIEEKVEDDDNVDVSVVTVISSESAPPGLPPPGEPIRPPLRVGMTVYAMKNSFGSWIRAKVLEVLPKGTSVFTSCRVKLENKYSKTPVLPARCLAYAEPASARMTIGTRVIALFKDTGNELRRETYYSGIVAEVPNPVNSYRYLIFFDDGYAQYASHADTRLVCECSALVWEEVHPFSREFVKEYLRTYPARPMVRLHPFQTLKTEWNGKWWTSKVSAVDASLAQVHFPVHNRYEWIYRGSTRLAPLYLELQAAERHRPRAMPRTQAHSRSHMPVVEYTRDDEQAIKSESEKQQRPQQQPIDVELSRQRAVAKKSTTSPSVSYMPPPPIRPPLGPNLDNVTSRVVYYTPKNAVKPHKMVPHTCSPKCKRSDVLALKDLRTYNPLAKPLLSGWERQIVRCRGQKSVAYRAPCGRRVRNVQELHRYLRATACDLPVDLFDFAPHTHCLAEFVLNKCLIMKKDLSQGKENVPVPCVNYYDQTLPEFCSYNTERTPTAGVPLNLDPEFLCGCDCEDDCEDKSKCACWKLTLEGARTIGLEGDNVGYVYKRLPEPLPSGIYECNSRCKCKHTCLNRVAQHPLQLKLQVFKTLNRGWGIRALNDVPKGAFLCVYAGNLLTDATANLDGLIEGDEYLAELDYIEVVEQMKEGYEEDIPEALKKGVVDCKKNVKEDEEDDDPTTEDEEESTKNESEDDDFRPGYIGLGVATFSKSLRERKKNKGDRRSNKEETEKEEPKKEEKTEPKKEKNAEDDCITISDDDEVREPSRFAAAAGMGADEFISKYRSVRALFGEDEKCYIMDAKVQGNIGRYLNHSCCPNVFVQNVFVDTHDPRFPWVAFFALAHIRAGTELTWNYNYDVGSVPGKALYCYCGAANCRGRLL